MIPRPLSSATVCTFAFLSMTAGVHADDTIVIGFGGGLTGDLAFHDALTRNGARMAVDEIYNAMSPSRAERYGIHRFQDDERRPSPPLAEGD